MNFWGWVCDSALFSSRGWQSLERDTQINRLYDLTREYIDEQIAKVKAGGLSDVKLEEALTELSKLGYRESFSHKTTKEKSDFIAPFLLKIASEKKDLDVLKNLTQIFTTDQLSMADCNGATPAIAAAINNNIGAIEVLAAAGVKDLNRPTENGATPASIAAQDNNVDLIKALIAAGVTGKDLSIPDVHGVTPAYIAADRGFVGVIKALAEGLVSPEDLAVARANDGATPAFAAACKGNVGVIKALAAAGVTGKNLCKPNANGATSAYMAAQLGYADIIEALVEGGASAADLNISKAGFTPAYVAAHSGNFDVLLALAKGGVDVSATLESSPAPILLARKNGCTPEKEEEINKAYREAVKPPSKKPKKVKTTRVKKEAEAVIDPLGV